MTHRGGRIGVLEPFANRSFTFYFSGQVISHTGTWFQNLALSLVVLDATGSARALSGVTVAQFLPLLLLSIPAGWVADRVRPRSILMVTSMASAVVVGMLAVVTFEPAPATGKIYLLVAALGTAHTFERVAAQALIYEIVGPSGLTRAVSVATIALASARSIGPGLAGLVFQNLGASACMIINASSFVLVFFSILIIRAERLFPRATRVRADSGRLSLRRNRALMTLLVVNVIITLFAFNLMLVLTATVTLTFEGDAASLGAVHALNALGAIVGGLAAAGRTDTPVRALAFACVLLGAALLVNAAAPTLLIFLVLGPFLGLGVGYFQGILHAAAQASVPPEQIGRTMSLVTLGNYGMMPFGALLIAGVIDAYDGRVALAVGGAAALLCAVFVVARLGWPRRKEPDARQTL